MKKYTLEDLKNSKQTLTKFFLLQGKATPDMIDEAFEFYCKVSPHKNRIKTSKKFTVRRFLREMNFYNSIMK